MKKVSDLIEMLESLPPEMPVYHFDGNSSFTFPKVEIAETDIEGLAYRYVMISSTEDKDEDDSKEVEITD